jgi:hypothetical protein
MKYFAAAILYCLSVSALWAQQPTFKVGWNTYAAGIMLHEYTYTCTGNDTSKLVFVDSAQVLSTSDSLVTLRTYYPAREKALYKTASFYNSKKMLVRTEDYKDDNLVTVNEWRYDDKNRKTYSYTEDKIKGNSYKKVFDYSTEKKTQECMVSECSYYNGKIEFYTRAYYDRNNVKYKEVRLNDNNKDVVHIESYTYGQNGKLKERSVYFPEWKVTRKFQEKEGSVPEKCYKSLPIPISEKISLATRLAFLKKLVVRNMALLMTDTDCKEFEYKFSKFNCEVLISPKATNVNRIVFRFRERL